MQIIWIIIGFIAGAVWLHLVNAFFAWVDAPTTPAHNIKRLPDLQNQKVWRILINFETPKDGQQ